MCVPECYTRAHHPHKNHRAAFFCLFGGIFNNIKMQHKLSEHICHFDGIVCSSPQQFILSITIRGGGVLRLPALVMCVAEHDAAGALALVRMAGGRDELFQPSCAQGARYGRSCANKMAFRWRGMSWQCASSSRPNETIAHHESGGIPQMAYRLCAASTGRGREMGENVCSNAFT